MDGYGYNNAMTFIQHVKGALKDEHSGNGPDGARADVKRQLIADTSDGNPTKA